MKISGIDRRLVPVYVSSFFGGLVFWYSIEKVFMQSIGFDSLYITFGVIVMSLTGLLLEVPSGILADRWSRKGVMAMAYLALALGSITLGLSTSVGMYLIASTLFGIYFSLHSGTVDSIIYDTLIEDSGSRKGFEKYLGRDNFISATALVIGSLMGGIIAESVSLQATYFITVPSALLAVIAALSIREPKIHKKLPEIELISHTKQTFKLIFQKGYITWIVVAVVATSVMYSFLLEIDQLWPLALSMPVYWYGPLNALLLLAYGLGGLVASKLIAKKQILHASFVVGLLAVVALSVQNMIVIAGAQFLVITLFVSYSTIMLGRLHDELPSGLRSGASSLVNTIINVAFIPSILIFGLVTQQLTIFHAPYVMMPIALVGIFFTIKTLRNHRLSKVSHMPIIDPPNTVSAGL